MTQPINSLGMDVSIIVATWNSARFLSEALASARAQAVPEIELLVVDKHSTDGTAAIARQFGAMVITQDTDGLAAAWNTGIARAHAPFIAFLDSDDTMVRDTLAERIRISAETGRMSVGRVRHCLAEGSLAPGALRPGLLDEERAAPIPGTLVIPKALFAKVGLFDASYEIAADVDWIARATVAGEAMQLLDRLVLLKRIHGANLSLRARENTAELLRTLRSKVRSGQRPGLPRDVATPPRDDAR